MKKQVASNDLMTTLARQMGHTAGAIVKATQELAAKSTHVLSGDAPEKPLRDPGRRATQKKNAQKKKRKKTTITPATLPSRKRSARAAATRKKKMTRKKKRRTT